MDSTLRGRIPNTNVAVDNCGSKDPDVHYRLVTHAHTDHHVGLSNRSNLVIHCSHMTKTLLLLKFPKLRKQTNIKGHSVGERFCLSAISSPGRRGVFTKSKKMTKRFNFWMNHTNDPNNRVNGITQHEGYDSEDDYIADPNNQIEVTLIDACHCPGSVMFLIKDLGHNKTYLHTGDFRLERSMLENPILTNIWIDEMYLDVTFCDKSYQFPKRNVIVEKLVKHIKQYWSHIKKQEMKEKKGRATNNDEMDVIYVDGEMLGTEYLLVELCKAVKFFGILLKFVSDVWRYFGHCSKCAMYSFIQKCIVSMNMEPNGVDFKNYFSCRKRSRF